MRQDKTYRRDMNRVWVNGSFDVLHIGHIKLLEYASTLGSVTVGLDEDDRIKTMKGSNRPFNCLEDRIEFLSAIKYVDSIRTFDTEDKLIELIKECEPHYMVIGSDYKDKRVIGCEYAKQIIFFNRIPNKSTTAILEYEKDYSHR